MAFPSLANLYTLVCALNLIQIALGAWIMYSFGWKETGEAQLTLMFAALYTLPMTYLLTRYQRRAEHRLSRVHENINFLAFMLCLLFFVEVLATVFVVVRGSTPVASCPPNRLLSFRCSPLILGLFLPPANCAIFVYAARLIRERARAIYGEEMVPLPSTPPLPVKLVPAWRLGRILELELEAEYAGPTGPLSI